MAGAFLITTSTEGLQPLGTAAQRSYELLSGALRDRLGEDYAQLLAEPIAAQHGDQIDWHAPIQGRAVRLQDLSGDQQARVRQELGQRTAKILAEAEILNDSTEPNAQRLGEALANAVELPSEAMIYVISVGADLHPVLVHWAWVQDETQRVRGVLTGMIARSVPLNTQVQATSVWANPIWKWLVILGWLLLAAILTALLWVLIAPCGLAPLGPRYCDKPQAELAAAYSEQRVLQDHILRLERELGLANRRCRAVVPVSPAAVPTPKPEKKGALPTGPDDASRRFAGLDKPDYTPLKFLENGN